MTEAVIYMDTVQRHVTRKPKKERKGKHIYHQLRSARDLMMIYIASKFHENVFKRVFKLYSEQNVVTEYAFHYFEKA